MLTFAGGEAAVPFSTYIRAYLEAAPPKSTTDRLYRLRHAPARVI
jgi:hypothetical protein